MIAEDFRPPAVLLPGSAGGQSGVQLAWWRRMAVRAGLPGQDLTAASAG